ncbi:carboxymuconolactone decarboxylase family protein [Elioraea sp.]|jgi:4-carboxymuconolactone decarboxylase|uniref:carboxymuconolactone decarboxylase family protein n=1 Tax=Elioraea sp. TaxID=2185103 RepID=UPI003F6FD393
MALIPIPDQPEDAETKAVFERIAASRGWVSNAMRALSAAPEGLRVFSAVGHYARYGTALTELQRELAILIVARSVPYAWAHHVPLGLQAGLMQGQIDAIGRGTTPHGLQPADRALCDYVFAFLAGKGIAPETATALNRQFSPRQVTDISLIAGYYLALGTMLLAFDVEIEPPEALAVELAWQRTQGGTR